MGDPNGYELRPEQFAGHASDIVKQGVDLIVCVGDDAIRAAQQASTRPFPHRRSLPASSRPSEVSLGHTVPPSILSLADELVNEER